VELAQVDQELAQVELAQVELAQVDQELAQVDQELAQLALGHGPRYLGNVAMQRPGMRG
jgi:hypothetical protein